MPVVSLGMVVRVVRFQSCHVRLQGVGYVVLNQDSDDDGVVVGISPETLLVVDVAVAFASVIDGEEVLLVDRMLDSVLLTHEEDSTDWLVPESVDESVGASVVDVDVGEDVNHPGLESLVDCASELERDVVFETVEILNDPEDDAQD